MAVTLSGLGLSLLLTSGGGSTVTAMWTALPQAPRPAADVPTPEPAWDDPVRISGSAGSVRAESAALEADDEIPVTALAAYRAAAKVMRKAAPDCNLRWTLLAAIGRVESDHGRYGGAVLRADGVSTPRIVGVKLDGRGPVARMRDSDAGRYDKDARWDRAVGPMQFLPSTWSSAGVDGDGDDVRNPHDLDDAALASAVYLCSGDRDLSKEKHVRAAVFRYNHSEEYVELVLALERSYRAGAYDVSLDVLTTTVAWPALAGTALPIADTTAARPERDAIASARAKSDRNETASAGKGGSAGSTGATTGNGSAAPGTGVPAGTPGPGSSPAPSPTPSPSPDPTPSPTPDPTPSPSPDPTPSPEEPDPSPQPEEAAGVWASCEAGWCLDDQPVDVSSLTPADVAGSQEGDTLEDALARLAGQQVVVTLTKTEGGTWTAHKIALP
jgi:hypothetical protein